MLELERYYPALPDIDFHARDGAVLMHGHEAHLQERHAAVGGAGGHEITQERSGGGDDGRAEPAMGG